MIGAAVITSARNLPIKRSLAREAPRGRPQSTLWSGVRAARHRAARCSARRAWRRRPKRAPGTRRGIRLEAVHPSIVGLVRGCRCQETQGLRACVVSERHRLHAQDIKPRLGVAQRRRAGRRTWIGSGRRHPPPLGASRRASSGRHSRSREASPKYWAGIADKTTQITPRRPSRPPARASSRACRASRPRRPGPRRSLFLFHRVISIVASSSSSDFSTDSGIFSPRRPLVKMRRGTEGREAAVV